MLQPIESVFFPMSKAVVGHTIPGILQRYPVSTVNYFDLTSALKHRKQSEDVVTKFPGMNEDHGKGSSIMEKLKAALNLKGADPRHTEYSKKIRGLRHSAKDTNECARTSVGEAEPQRGHPPFPHRISDDIIKSRRPRKCLGTTSIKKMWTQQ